MYGQKAIFVAKVRKKIQLFSHLEENLLERTHFEVLMPHQSVIMPPIYTFMKVKYVKSALTSQGGKKNQGTLIRKQHLGLKIEEGIPES